MTESKPDPKDREIVALNNTIRTQVLTADQRAKENRALRVKIEKLEGDIRQALDLRDQQAQLLRDQLGAEKAESKRLRALLESEAQRFRGLLAKGGEELRAADRRAGELEGQNQTLTEQLAAAKKEGGKGYVRKAIEDPFAVF